MDDAARKVAKCMEDEPGEMTRQDDGKLEPRLLDMILNLVAARMVKQYEFDAKRWGKGLSAVAVE